METLHKLAGVKDASDLTTSSNERPSQPTIVSTQPSPPLPPPAPEKDLEAQHNPGSLSRKNSALSRRGSQLSHRGSRASLPLNRQPSHKSFRSSKHQRSRSASRVSTGAVAAPHDYPAPPAVLKETAGASAPVPSHRTSHDSAGSRALTTATSATSSSSADEDFPWGPSHPCFPHPNPHCAPHSADAASTRVIRVRRDWLAAGDTYPAVANLYPEILDPLVSDAEFRFLVSSLNARLRAAFDPYSTRAWVDAVMGVLTGWAWEDAGLTGVKSGMKGVERWMAEWNAEMAGKGRAVRVVGVRETGFMSLDFVVPDPGLDGEGGREE
ncbi:hypothetical protein LTR53_011081 [Teratosphaeriaceae sp. CCFEE 6253]|nr:hypothetical protein LTR53_011081 [Teratosphaeriaceae sp. CCFEE 6253]